MIKKIICAGLLIFFAFGFSVFAQEKTLVNDANAKKMLLGKHLFSLQWISWDYFGAATVTDQKGTLYLKGEQKGRGNADFVTIDGTITEINKTDFKFDGTVTTQVSYINGGKPCKREGSLTFAVSGKRKYWRMKEIDNPCDTAADYVDVYFR